MKLLGKHKGTVFSLLAVTGAIAFLCRGLITKPGIIAGYDVINFFGGLEIGEKFNLWFQSWDASWVLGGSALGIAGKFFSPYNFLLAKLNPLYNANIYTVIILLLAGILCYLFVYHHLKNVYSSAAAGTLYAINCFTLWSIQQPREILGYALFPVLLLLFDRTLEHRTFKDISFFSLFAFFFITSSYMPIVYISAFALALFAVIWVLASHEGKVSARLAGTSKVSPICVALIVGLLAYQWFPIIAGASPAALSMGYSIREALLYSNPIGQSFLMLPNPWSVAHTTSDFLFLIIVAALAFSALLFRRDKYTIFFTASALIAVFLAKGPQPPLESIYIWLSNHVPGFAALRQTDRWYMLLSLSYAYLLGVSIKFIPPKLMGLFKTKSLLAERLLSIFLVAVVIATCFLATRPQSLIANPGTFDLSCYPEYTEAEEAYALIGSRDENIYCIFPIIAGEGLILATPQIPLKAKEYGLYHYKTVRPVSLYYQSGQPHWEYPGLWLSYRFPGYREFVDSQMNEQSTTKFMDFLGSQNVKYIVIDKTKKDYLQFFQKQDNCELIFDKETVAVYENEKVLPHLYAAPASAMLIGGLNSLLALPSIPNFSYSDLALLSLGSGSTPDMTILYNTDVDDLVMLSALNCGGGVQRLDIDKYATVPWWREVDKEEFQSWVLSDWWCAKGEFVFGPYAVRTGGQNTLQIPFTVDESSDYQVWLRIAYAPDRGNLETLVDGNSALSLTPKANLYYGFKFVKVSLHLEEGDHTLELRNDDSGFNDVDEVFLIKSDALPSIFSTAAQNASSKVVYCQDATRFFSWSNLGVWSASSYIGKPTSVIDDNQASLWNVVEQEKVSVYDDEDIKKHGANSLKIVASGEERGYSTMLEHIFPDYQDWSDEERISFYFYGNDTGANFNLGVMSGDGDQDYAIYGWVDDFTGWRQLSFPVDSPHQTYGNVDWTEVKRLRIGNSDRSVSGIWFLDNLGVIKGSEAARIPIEVIGSGDTPFTISADFRPLREGKYVVAIRAMAGEQWEVTQYVPDAIIANDNQASLWNVVEQEKVSVYDDEDIKKHGANSLKIVASGEERGYSTMLEHIFPDYQDWSDEERISFYFYGNDTGANFNLGVMSGDGDQDYAIYGWVDDFTGWRQLSFPVDSPHQTYGNVDWTEVKRLRIGNSDRSVSGIWHLDDVTLGEMVTVTVGKSPEDSKLYMGIEGTNKTILFDGFTSQFQWLEVGPISLDGTTQTIKLTNDGAIYIDKVLLYPYTPQFSLDTLFKRESHTFLDYEKLSPTKYRVRVNTDEPFWLVFPEIYHPLWQARVDGETISSTPTSLYLNSFYITKAGEYELMLEFTPQRYVKYGGIVSLATLGFMIMGIVITKIRHRKVRKA